MYRCCRCFSFHFHCRILYDVAHTLTLILIWFIVIRAISTMTTTTTNSLYFFLNFFSVLLFQLNLFCCCCYIGWSGFVPRQTVRIYWKRVSQIRLSFGYWVRSSSRCCAWVYFLRLMRMHYSKQLLPNGKRLKCNWTIDQACSLLGIQSSIGAERKR